MKLVKTTKKHYIYELSDKELSKGYTTYRYQLFLKASYEDIMPCFNLDIGYADFEADTFEFAIQQSV